MRRIYCFVFAFCSLGIMAQEGVRLNTSEAFNGYLLYENNQSTYLVDNCGEIVHSWFGVSNTELHSKLQTDGTLTYISSNEQTLNVRDWENSLIYSYTVNESDLHLVYEAILMPNGNYLCLSRRYLSDEDFLEMGYDPDYLASSYHNPRRMDGVVEINPTTNSIVWEWNFKDHVLQDRDPSAGNYGNARDNPQLMNIERLYDSHDWHFGESFMINGFDYNPELDQIALSVRKMGEIAIIDHSTTTAQAKGSTGGNSGMGGDFIYRWGNPANYGRGTAADRILYYQHNPNWIEHGQHKGKLICFNNGLDRPDVTNFDDQYSAVPIFDPIEDGFKYVLDDGMPYAPVQPEVNYDRHDSNTFFFSGYTSAAKVLPNGNILITQGVDGRVFEINEAGDKVWEYVADGYNGGSYLFRSEKYGADHPALIDKDLSSTGETVEFPSTSYNCQLTVSDMNIEEPIIAKYRMTENFLFVTTELENYTISVFDMLGRKVHTANGSRETRVDLESLSIGAYVLHIKDKQALAADVFKFVKQ